MWEIEDQDIEKVISFYNKWSNDPFVMFRQKKNIDIPRPIITKERIWMALVGCLLTTQQRSGPGKPVNRFLNTDPFILNYKECSSKDDLEGFVREKLTLFRGIRRAPTIAKQISNNYKILEDGLWPQLLSRSEEINMSNDPGLEREAIDWLTKNRNHKPLLMGIGPKQSRNILQGIGVSKYEIPVDSRITKWLNKNLLKFRLSAYPLSDHVYFNLVSDGIQLLCKRANLYPCMLDAAIFTSFDKGWSESDIGSSESLANA